ncbi:MAG: hypothetical protein IT245_06720 [Bacteroidia bacterium]|nr:hypothetical protein [Bacteroidia bacterium]
MAYNWWLRGKGLTGISYWDCMNPVKFISVLFGFIMSVVFPLHIFEQYALRFYDVDCRKNCLNSEDGACEICGCNTKAKMWSPFEHCSNNNWPKIIWSKKKYIEFRKLHPATLKPIYGTI